MGFFSFYKRKADFALRIKFITFKFSYTNYFLKDFMFEFKSASCLSIGSFILLYNIFLRFSELPLKQISKSIKTLHAYGKMLPQLKTTFSLAKRRTKKKNNFFKFLAFSSSYRVASVAKEAREGFDSENHMFVTECFKSFQQTSLSFSSHVASSIKFSEAYHSFFWKLSAPLFTFPGFTLQREIVDATAFSATGLLQADLYGAVKKTASLPVKFYLLAAKAALFSKHRTVIKFIFSNTLNTLTF